MQRVPIEFCLVAMMAACAHGQNDNSMPIAPRAEATSGTPAQDAGREIVLAPGASRRVPDTDLTVSFDEVVEDSRCPTGTTCVWAGDAAIRIRIAAAEASPSSYTLHTSEQFAREVTHGSASVRLVALAPYPVAGSKPRPDEYRATLSIHRK